MRLTRRQFMLMLTVTCGSGRTFARRSHEKRHRSAAPVDQEPPPHVRYAQALAAETGALKPTDSERVRIDVPDVAEDGAIVPLTIDTDLPSVDRIAVLVEKNPNPFIAGFDLKPGLDPFVSLRIKMNETSEVTVVVRSEGQPFLAKKKVRVVVGGCG